ncbi:hypothetical protein M427DRAFT_131168 [Gonapodya prolifera JEL478]|uniref:DUF599-domain-containing protein n=1 Tax=Gonapodya prolifera (strain JEL478) TaxID=1344416 RepID=A0A139AWD3_GONPJ|nr:hypothetical protein M427DRAFT_131168 [Gonapodya prolifera JEL478]|eukprot:KXS21014.1 hypothetical protein M427DRAFT_131168 [Gonapodya prolifera JEL478]
MSTTSTDTSSALDLGCGLAFLVLVVGYHGWLFTYTEMHPHATVNGIANAARTAWITGILKKPDNILAAQLLRNWVLTAQLLGTASISVMFGMLAFVVNTNTNSTTPDFIGFAGTFRGFKIAILLLIYLMAFLCFAQVARLFGHTLISYTASNYALNPPKAVQLSSVSAATHALPTYPIPTALAPDLLADLLNSGAFYWTIGTRLFSFSFPVLLWFFGAVPMLATGAVTVAMLVVLDLAGVTAQFERWVSGEDEEFADDDGFLEDGPEEGEGEDVPLPLTRPADAGSVPKPLPPVPSADVPGGSSSTSSIALAPDAPSSTTPAPSPSRRRSSLITPRTSMAVLFGGHGYFAEPAATSSTAAAGGRRRESVVRKEGAPGAGWA